MTEEERNAALMRQAATNWNDTRGNAAAWLDIAADDVALWSVADSRHAMEEGSSRYGTDALRAYLEGVTSLFAIEYWNMGPVVAQGDRVAAVVSAAVVCRKTGKRAESRIGLFARFRDGKLVELDEFYDTAAIAAAMS
jgi:ketosteroid isomerase-like protein